MSDSLSVVAEKEKIIGLDGVNRNRLAAPGLLSRITREDDAPGSVSRLHQARAVDPPGSNPAPEIGGSVEPIDDPIDHSLRPGPPTDLVFL